MLKRSFSALKIATFSAAIRACARASSRYTHGTRGRAKDARQRSQLHRSLRFSERGGTRVAQATFFTPSLVSEKKL